MNKFYLTLFGALLLCFCFSAKAQTTLLNPTGDGGFETGSTFALNTWTTANSGTTAANNPWTMGTSSVFAGTYGAYIGPTNNPGNGGSGGTVRVSHLYRNVTLPAGATNIKLTFYLKEPTVDDGWDYLYVYTTATTNTPVAGTLPGAAYTTQYSNTSTVFSSHTLQTVTLPNSLAGTTFRMVFTYYNDGVSPAANPQLDNIGITYCPNVTRSATASPTTLCAGATMSLTSSVTGATAYSWSGPGGYTAVTQNPSAFVASTSGAGIYTVTGTVGSCSYTATTSSVTVNALPGSITGTTGMCVGGSTTLSVSPSGGTWYSLNTSVATVNSSTGQVFGASAGTATISYATSCGSSTVTATVASAPTAIGGTFSICKVSPSTVSLFTAQSWESGVPTTSGTPVAGWSVLATTTYLSAVTTGASPTVSAAQDGTNFLRWRSNAAPAATTATIVSPSFSLTSSAAATLSFWVYRDVTAAVNTSAYNLEGFNFYINTSASLTGATLMGFVPRAGIVSTSGSYISGTATTSTGGWYQYTCTIPGTFTGATNYLLINCYSQAGNNCFLDNVTLNASPFGSTTLTDGVSGGTWSSGTTSVATINSTTGLLTAVSQGASNITYTSCAASAYQSITIKNNPAAITGTLSMCVGASTTLANTAIGGTWSSSDMGIASINSATGVVTGVSGGIATITYSNSCGTDATAVVTINAAPVAIAPLSDVDLCIGLTTSLTNTSTGGTWTSGSPSTATVGASTGVVGGAAAGTVTITYSNGCGAPTYKTITVNTPPASITGLSSVCEAGSTTFSNSVAGGTWYTSDAGIANVDASTGMVYGVTGGNTVINYATPGCTPATRAVTVVSIPAAIGGASTLCPSQSTTLSNTVSGGTWSSSNTAIVSINSTTGYATASATPGTVTITYNNGCAPSATRVVTVSSTAGPITGIFTLCASQTLNLFPAQSWESGAPNSAGTAVDGWNVLTGDYNSGISSVSSASNPTLASAQNGTKFLMWNSFTSPYEDGTSATLYSPSFSLTGVSNASLKFWVYRDATGVYPYASHTTEGFNVYINSTPSLSGATLLGFVPRAADGPISGSYITGTSTTGTSAWNQYTCSMPGSYSGGTNYILIQAWSNFGNNCFLDNVSFTGSIIGSSLLSNSTAGGTWSSANTAIATVVAGTGMTYGVTGGTTNITYTPPCGSAVTQAVTVNPAPGSFSGTTTICQGTTSTLSNSAGSGTWSSSNTAIATVNSTSGAVTGVSGGTATISYSNGCGATATTSVTVKAYPAAITGSTSLCPGGSGTLVNTVTGGTWTSGTPSVATVNSSTGAVGAVASSGSTVITYSNGCLPNATVTLTVSSTPSPITGVTQVCAPNTVTLLVQDWETPAFDAVPSGTTPVNGWFQLTTPATNYMYTYDAGSTSFPVISAAQSGSYFLSRDYSGTTAQTVCSPSFSMVGLNGAQLTFWIYRDGSLTGALYAAEGFTIYANTSASLTGATTLGFVPRSRTRNVTGSYISGNSTVASAGWQQYTCTLPATFTGTTNYVMFSAVGAGGNETYLDNITLVATARTTQLTDATPGGTWSSSNTSIATVGSTTGLVTGVATGTVNISYTTTCGAVGTSFTVNPVPGSISGTTSVCPGATTTLSNTASGGTWSSSNTSIATVNAATGAVSGVTPGTVTISYSTGCGNAATTSFTVKSLPATITGATSLCPSSSGTLYNTTTGGTWTSSSPSVASVNSSTGAIAAGASPGTTTITYSNGCSPNATTTVTVSNTTAPITGTTSLCAPYGIINTVLAQSFNSGLTGETGGTWTVTNSGASSIYNWAISTPGDFWSTDYSYTGDGSPFIGTNADAAGTGVNLITALSAPAFSTVGMTSGSLSFNYYCNSNSTYDSWAKLEYSTNGSTWTTLYDYYNTITGATSWTAGTPTQTISLTSGMLGQSAVYLRWNYNSTYGFNWILDNVLVKGSFVPTTSLSDATPGGSWSSASTSVATVNSNGVVYAVGAGSATISYAGPCGTPVTTTVTVNPTPAAISGAGTFCVGTTLSLSNSAAGGTWSSSNTLVATVNSSTGLVYGVSAGSATISYATGCGNAATASVIVKNSPAAISGATSLCPSSSTFLTNSVSGGTWSSSNTSVASINATTGALTSTATPGTTTITYTNGCSPDVTSIVTVSSTTDAIVGASSICAAPTSLVFNSFENGVPTTPSTSVDGWNYIQGTGAANSYWSSATASSTANPSAGSTPTGGGTKVAQFNSRTIASGNTAMLVSPAFSLSGGNGGRVSFYFYRDATAGVLSNYDSVAVYVNTSPVLGGNWIGSVCRSTTRTTTYTGTAPASGWFKYTYSIPTTYTGSTNYIIIKGYSAAGNNMYLDSILIRNNSGMATMTDATPGGTWSTDAPSVATITSAGVVTAISAGTANISYTGACGSPVVHPITVNPVPGSNTSGPTTLCIGATTTIANALGGGTWSSSNASVASVDVSGNVTALASGTATISYMTDCGNPATTVFTVNPVPTVASVTPSATTLCAGATLTLTAGAVAGTGTLSSYNWSGPEGYAATSTATADAHTVSTSASTGVFTLSVTYPGLGCTSSQVTTGTVNVYEYPLAQTVSGGNGCSATGITVGLTGSQSGMTYNLYQNGVSIDNVTGTGGAVSFAPVTAVAVYTVQAMGTGGCNTAMTGSDTIRQTPSVVLGVVPNICNPLTSVPVSYSSAVGSPTTYSIDWDATANALGISDVTGATLSGGNINFTIPASGAVGYFTNSITVSNGYCVSSNYNKNLTVYAQPQMTITAVNAPCVGYAGSIDFTGTDSAVVDYTVDGGPVSHFTFTGTTHSLSTGVITTAHTYVIQSAHNPVCSNSYDSIRVVDPIPMKWVGGAPGHESEWNYAANWTCGFEPTANDDVTINAATYTPTIPGSGSATSRDLTMLAGSALLINGGASLNVKGNINNASTVSGSGKVVMNGSTAQTISGIGSISNFELNNSAGATINSGSRMMIGKTLYISAGTLTTNDSLELLSTDTFTPARIAEMPASGAIITGKVKVGQFIDSGYRRFRFWSHPFSSAIALIQLQSYIDITGSADTAGGFTHTGSNAPSAFRYDPYKSNSAASYDSGWRAFTRIKEDAADSNKLHPGQGMRLFLRGAKGEGLGYNGYFDLYTPSSTIIKMSGPVNQGNVDVTLAQGSNPTTQSFNMLGNPYASPVDIGTVLYNAKAAGEISGSAFYVWRPKVAYGGQYMAIPIGVGAPIPYYIQANAAFQVMADHDGAQLHFTESNKSAIIDNYMFKAPSDFVTLNVYDASGHIWDRLDLQFNEKATTSNDKKYDAIKPMGSDLNFYAIAEDGVKMAIDSRPYDEAKTIPLGINSTFAQEFVIRAENVAIPNNGMVTLHDKLLGKYIDMTVGAEYKFTIGKDKATQGDNRFELSLKPAVNATKPLAVTLKPNPASDDVKISFSSGMADIVTVRVMDISGVTIFTQDLGSKQNGIITVPMSNFAAGVYMVEVTQGSQKVTQRLVKE